MAERDRTEAGQKLGSRSFPLMSSDMWLSSLQDKGMAPCFGNRVELANTFFSKWGCTKGTVLYSATRINEHEAWRKLIVWSDRFCGGKGPKVGFFWRYQMAEERRGALQINMGSYMSHVSTIKYQHGWLINPMPKAEERTTLDKSARLSPLTCSLQWLFPHFVHSYKLNSQYLHMLTLSSSSTNLVIIYFKPPTALKPPTKTFSSSARHLRLMVSTSKFPHFILAARSWFFANSFCSTVFRHWGFSVA